MLSPLWVRGSGTSGVDSGFAKRDAHRGETERCARDKRGM